MNRVLVLVISTQLFGGSFSVTFNWAAYTFFLLCICGRNEDDQEEEEEEKKDWILGLLFITTDKINIWNMFLLLVRLLSHVEQSWPHTHINTYSADSSNTRLYIQNELCFVFIASSVVAAATAKFLWNNNHLNNHNKRN